MAKEVKMRIEISENGDVHLLPPEGTVGAECHDLQKVLENIKGFALLESLDGDDAHLKHQVTTIKQNVNR